MGVFDRLTPDLVVSCAEQALGMPFGGLTIPLPSYINRVYEIENSEHRRFVIKFYRPGRWPAAAIQEEHRFVLACEAADIPVIAPLRLQTTGTLGCCDNLFSFAIFPKRSGRPLEIREPEDWRRLGMLLARMHLSGDTLTIRHRTVFTPDRATRQAIENLLNGDFISSRPLRENFHRTAFRLLDRLLDAFERVELTVLHGDCHCGNILDRPDEGMMLIDFDDMLIGPAVQDLWLLLPDYAPRCQEELELLLEGYEMLRDFDRRTLKLIEPLRAMRMLYFLDWCSRQIGDYQFQRLYPDWGSDNFWRREIGDLNQQLQIIQETL
ncbi:serine/threonine protein kinase [Victivallis sp. Marseille-Q1083]|uniref:serine/threonine protein kinase n=1 Tax=Victivallis sp. Marseille-Q1083 TaxID=2717288 RepID=UPI001588DF03|nr:serine/threonine protein kinase [Victivallis sp. Marseille-Q1083]